MAQPAAPAFWGGDEVNAIVIDIGAASVKAGYAGEDTPRAVFPSVVGRVQEDGGNKTLYAGHQALMWRRDFMEVVSPFEQGQYKDWDIVLSLWDHIFKDRLRIKPEEHPMMLAELPFNSRESREKMVEAMFETYAPPALFLGKNAVLSSFATGRPTSLVVDVGHEGAVVAAVHEGYVLQKSVVRAPLGGALLTRCMQTSIEAKGTEIVPGYSVKRIDKITGQIEMIPLSQPNTTASFRGWHVEQIAADVKESVCRVSEGYWDPDQNSNIPMVSYELPDGNEIQVGADRFTIPEILFQPKLLGRYPGADTVRNYDGGELPGLTGMILDSINRCDVDVRRDMFNGVVLTGGTSQFNQMRDRLERELTDAAPQTAKVKVISPNHPLERRFSVWIGGSILASLGSFQQMWMSLEEYKENGASRIHRKAP